MTSLLDNEVLAITRDMATTMACQKELRFRLAHSSIYRKLAFGLIYIERSTFV